MLDLWRLRIFMSVVEGGSFTAAAGQLFLSQPAVSQQMATLQREVGVALLERTSRGISLTAAGQVLAERAATLLAAMSATEEELHRFGAGVPEVRLGVFPTAGADLAPLAIRMHRERHPKTKIALTPIHGCDSAAQVIASHIDIGLIWDYDYALQPTDPALERLELLADPLRIVLPVDHPLATESAVALHDLAEEEWVVRDHLPPYAHAFEAMCRIVGFEPHIVFRTDNYQAVQGLVAAGIGVGIVPQLSLAPCRSDIVLLPLISPAFSRRIAAITLRKAERPVVIDGMLHILSLAAEDLRRSFLVS